MAEAVLFSLATNILNSLAAEVAKPGGSFASQKIQLLCGAKDELQSLDRTLQSIQAVLLDAEKQQWHNNRVKLWLKRLKDVLYDVQDLFDDVATENLRRKVASGNKIWKEVRLFFSKSNQLAHRLKVANKIQELRKTLDGIEKDNKDFNLGRHLSEETMAIGRGKKPEFSAPDEQIIGREEDKEDIKRLLFDPSSSDTVSFVSIVGKGGLGKTALARLVFHDREVEKHFDLKMWVCVSDVFDVKFIIKEILRSAGCQGQDHENKSIEELQSLLRETLARKKYLLVLDDMWNEVRLKWLELGDWLKGGVRGSKILITTRSHTVARVTDEKSAIYDLQGLPRDESWDLFREAAFGDRRAAVDQGLEEMGRDIVRKCAGVPLAIRTVGSLLYGKKEDGWLHFKVKELPEIPEIDAVDNGIMQVLQFNYDHLPSCLKHCFAYCSLFPKDYVYEKQTMIQLWVAQGFIESPNGEDNLEEIADTYLSDLLYRSFVDVADIGNDGELVAFKMHDLMHDLAQKVAGDECQIVDFEERGTYEGIRHASFPSGIFPEEEMMSLLKTSTLRTFFFLEGYGGLPTRSSGHDKVFSRLRHCRVLGLGKAEIPLPPSSIRKWKHLRFLYVSGNESIESLPDSIMDLVNLQTLKLSGCERLTTLPRDLKKMVNLRHLLIDGCDSLSHMPCGLNHLSSLQSLSQFIVQKMDHKVPGGVGSLGELGGLNRLGGSIALRNLEFLQPAPEKFHLREKQRLRSLELAWSRDGEEDDKSERDESILWENLCPHQNLTNLSINSCMSRSPPSWLSSIKNVVELTLYECGKWKYLPPLGELSSLRMLTLDRLNALEFLQEISDQEQFHTQRPIFPSLEELRLFRCRNMKGWWGRRQQLGADQDHWQYDSHSTFPKLSVVDLRDCDHLNSLPFFPQVKTLDFWGRVCAKLLEPQVMAVPNYPSEAAVSTSTPLSKLEHLWLDDVADLEDSMLETLLPFLGNLRSMILLGCRKLRSLSHGMQYLSSLSSLIIGDCEELDLSSHDDEHGTQWRSLAKLRDLRISKLPKLVALPEGIRHVTTLQSLMIKYCENLTSLPEWIALQELDVSGCSGLTCLPNGVRRLTSMKKLKIYRCSILQDRCQRESGADWEKIAHLSCSITSNQF